MQNLSYIDILILPTCFWNSYLIQSASWFRFQLRCTWNGGSTLIGIIGIHRPEIIAHRIKFIVGVLAPPAPHVPSVVDEAADVEVRGVNEPVQC